MSFLSALPPIAPGKTLIVLLAIALVMGLDVVSRLRHRHYHYAFGVIVGTGLSAGLLQFASLLLSGAGTPYVMGIGVLLLFLLWRLLFGAWETHVKAAVLGSFILWVGLRILWKEGDHERTAHLLAFLVAVIPALLWSLLFLKYHRERLSTVMVMFFGGIVSTAPILFYDALLKRGVEMQLFFLRIVPENFNDTVGQFIREAFPPLTEVQGISLSLLFTFLLVAFLEECCKFWVLKSTGKYLYSSIDDVIQMGVLVAIGFAFAENILNEGYFLGFVRDYLTEGRTDWASFVGNVAGRSVLTSMVHILSTGVMGYFLGLAVFAGPYLQEQRPSGPLRWLLSVLMRAFGRPQKDIFRSLMLISGLSVATALHALSNFMVSLPDSLPGNPRTLGDIFQAPPGSPLHWVALLLFPSLLYVGGGFWLLSFLFTRAENMRERGRVFTTDTFVSRGVLE